MYLYATYSYIRKYQVRPPATKTKRYYLLYNYYMYQVLQYDSMYGMYDDVAFIRCLPGVEHYLDFCDGFFKASE